MPSAAPKIGSSATSLALGFLLQQDNYPCIGALTALRREEVRTGEFSGFGLGRSWRRLRDELEAFVAEQRATRSTYLTYVAGFPGEQTESEEAFEGALWRELSYLTSLEDADRDWGGADRNPASPDFCFHLNGEKIFVVGLHPLSSRLSRRFPFPAMVFNLFSQFAELQAQGKYGPMVRINRERDRKFQGSANPMAEAHGETWESIQFSGRENPKQWKCPFSFLHRAFKP
jgi:FPC/CPF motif-containing protein YcgG